MKLSFSIHFLGWWLTGQKWLARGQYSKPSISVSPKNPIAQGGNVLIHCKTDSYWGKVFELYKETTPLTGQMMIPAQNEPTFHIPNVQPTNGGLYFCRYCFGSGPRQGTCSHLSDTVEIFITVQLYPAPSLSTSPSTVIAVGGNVIISCKSDKYPNAKFHLYKDRSLSILEAKKKEQNEVAFFIANATLSDGGIYQCKYCFRFSTTFYEQCSHYSSSKQIFIRDPGLPKPSIKACPSQEVAPGLNITIVCQGPEKDLNFSLYKSSTLIASQITETNSKTSKFSFFMVNVNDTGNYTCQYHNRSRPFVWSPPSALIQIVVRDKDPDSLDKRIIWAGVAAVSLFLVLLLLAYILYRKRKKGSSANRRPQPLPVKETNRPLETEAEEDPCGVSYAVLKLQSPNSKQAANPDRVLESCVYASVANDRTRTNRQDFHFYGNAS